MSSNSGSTLLKVVGAIVFIAIVAAALYKWLHPDPCAFGTYKKSIGVDLGATIAGKDLIKTNVGLSDAESRDFDSILNDYAAVYETSCRQHQQKVINDAEYACRSRKMQDALNAIRNLQVALESAAKLDPAAQKEAAQKALDTFRALPRSSDLSSCGPNLSVDPDQITFRSSETEHVIHVSNGGNASTNFTVTGGGDAIHIDPTAGALATASPVPVELIRMRTEVDPAVPMVIQITDSQGNNKKVTITIAADNAHVFDELTNQVVAAAGKQNRAPTLEDVRDVLSLTHSITGTAGTNGAASDIVAAQVLVQAGQRTAAQKAVEAAVIKSPTLNKEIVSKAIFKSQIVAH